MPLPSSQHQYAAAPCYASSPRYGSLILPMAVSVDRITVEPTILTRTASPAAMRVPVSGELKEPSSGVKDMSSGMCCRGWERGMMRQKQVRGTASAPAAVEGSVESAGHTAVFEAACDCAAACSSSSSLALHVDALRRRHQKVRRLLDHGGRNELGA